MDLQNVMEEINSLKNKRIPDLEDRMLKVQLSLERHVTIVEQNTKVMEKFSHTLDSIKDTMIEIASDMRANSQITEQLTHNVSKLSEKISAVDDKVDRNQEKIACKIADIEKKSQIDLMEIAKKLAVTFLMGGSGMGAVWYLLNFFSPK